MADEESPEPLAPTVYVTPDMAGGVYANFAQVSHSLYEFTLDFARLDLSHSPPDGVVVARVSLSPLLVSQLIEALQINWQKYAQKALPQEVYDNGDDAQTGQG